MTPPKAPPVPPNAGDIKIVHNRVPTPAEQLAKLPPAKTPLNAPLPTGPIEPPPGELSNVSSSLSMKEQLSGIAMNLDRIAHDVPTPNVVDSQLHGAQLKQYAAQLRELAK
jgi:hypothetical protein